MVYDATSRNRNGRGIKMELIMQLLMFAGFFVVIFIMMPLALIIMMIADFLQIDLASIIREKLGLKRG